MTKRPKVLDESRTRRYKAQFPEPAPGKGCSVCGRPMFSKKGKWERQDICVMCYLAHTGAIVIRSSALVASGK